MVKTKQKTKRKGILGIRQKLIVIVLALSIIPLLVMTLLLTRTLKDNVSDLQEDIAKQKLENATKETLSMVNETFIGVDLLSRNTTLTDALSDPTNEQYMDWAYGELENADAGFSNEGLMFIYDMDGMQIARADDGALNDISDRD